MAIVVLVFLRLATFVALAPLLGTSAPPMLRAGLALLLTAVVGPALALASPPPPEGVLYAALCAKELLLGALAGILVRFVVDLFASVGELFDQVRGAAQRSIHVPQHQDQSSSLGGFATILALCALFTTRAHLLLVAGIFRWFQTLPVTTLPDAGTLGVDVAGTGLAFASGLFHAALELAAPAVILAAVCDLASCFVGRSATQVHLEALGAGVRVLLGLWMAIAQLPVLGEAFLARFLAPLLSWLWS